MYKNTHEKTIDSAHHADSEKQHAHACCEHKALRELLKRWGGYMVRIDELHQSAAEAREAADSARIAALEAMRLNCTEAAQGAAVAAAEHAQAEYISRIQRLATESAALIQLRSCITGLLERMEPMQEKVITLRYVNAFSWRTVADRLKCDESAARRHERRAVDFIARNMVKTPEDLRTA